MAKPEFYPHPVSGLEQRETHISKVFLTGAYVYKIKKSVNLKFLDYTTLEKRLHFCRQEILLNRRLSRDIYLDVVSINVDKDRYALSGPGPPVEYAVKMRQLAQDRSLVRLLKHGEADRTTIRRLSRTLADFYRRAIAADKAAAFGSWESIREDCADNFAQTERFAGKDFAERTYQIVRSAVRTLLNRRRSVFQRRVEKGMIRDCHGDLRSGHIYFDDGIQIIDCIEFNEGFRYVDIISDIAFLAMDLDFEGFPEVAEHLIDACAEYTDDPDIFVLLDFYKCYRAMVRVKVNCLRSENKMIGDGEKAKLLREIDRHLDLAYRYALRFTRPTLWVVCGMPASGKSTVSDELAGALDIKVLRSDLVRKAMFGLKADAHTDLPFEAGVYSEQSSALVYGRLLLLAQEEMEKGHSVILDATFSRKHQRQEAARLARDMDCSIVFVECTCSENTSRDRLRRREKTAGISDARLHHFEHFKSRFEPLDDVPEDMRIPVNTDTALGDSMRNVFLRDHALLSGWIARKEKEL